MIATTEPTYVDGWQEISTVDGYRVVGSQDNAWFTLGPLNNVIAHPPAHLTIWEALDWFRRQQNAQNGERHGTTGIQRPAGNAGSTE